MSMGQTPGTNGTPRRRRGFFGVLKSVFKWMAIVLVALIAAGVVYQQVSLYRDDELYPMPGRLVSVGTHRLHLYCLGDETTAPTVILESGALFISTGWQWVMDDLSKTTRVCTYDRAGMGWSEPGEPPFDGLQMAADLHALLREAGIKTPVLFVGHSLGGMLGRIYYDRYPGELAGLIMIEPGDPDIFLAEVAAERGREVERTEGVIPCGMRCDMAVAFNHLGLVRLALGFIDLANDPLYPPGMSGAFIARLARTANIEQMMAGGRYVTRIVYQTRDNVSLGDLPVMLIYSTGFGELMGAEQTEAERIADREKNVAAWSRTLATSSRNMGLRVVEDANHVTIVAHKVYAEQVAGFVREMIAALPPG